MGPVARQAGKGGLVRSVLSPDEQRRESDRRDGVITGLIAYTLWGLFPIYFKIVEAIPPSEVLVHRIVWAVPFGAVIIHFRKQWPEVRRALANPGMLFWLGLAALFISVNWFIYIWAVQQDKIFQTSLGYYINPLIYVLVGVVFFGDRLRGLQIAAVISASIGVAILTISGGEFPFIAISLALLFTFYGVIRKQVAVGAMPGLFVETLLLFPFAIVWLVWLMQSQNAGFVTQGLSISALLMLAGPITVLPLLFFALAARRLTLTTVGFMQFLAPTLQFCVGLWYGEQLTTPHMICFGLIWLAVLAFSTDAIRASKKPPQAKPVGAD